VKVQTIRAQPSLSWAVPYDNPESYSL